MQARFLLFALTILTASVFAVYIVPQINRFLVMSGFVEEEVLIAGTGSMYPTFPKGTAEDEVLRANETVAWPKMRHYPTGFELFGKRYFGYDLKRGDIVEFENDTTRQISTEKYEREAGFIKRLIALPGDVVELRDGFVLLNGNILREQYTALPRSTYAGTSIPDCEQIRVPEGKVFILGDNRKASFDSRHSLGFVDIKDIKFVLPFVDQGEYKQYWRDVTNDLSLAHTATLDGESFTQFLNKKRTEKNVKALKYSVQLSKSAKLRGEAMISANDFSTEATKSGKPMKKTMQEAGYDNILYAETYTRGYFEAEELLDNFIELPETSGILFSDQYQDVGVDVALGEVNGCPTQVVVAHFGGYVPPNYPKETVDNWQKGYSDLDQTITQWEKLKEIPGINVGKLEELLAVLRKKRDNASRILAKLKANRWLTEEEKQLMEDDKSLNDEAARLIETLNKQE